GGGDAWAIEQNYRSLKKVYKFLDAPGKVGVRLRDGDHGVSERDIESYMDWLDIQFERKNLPWDNKLFYNYTFDRWKELSGETLDLNQFPEITAQKSNHPTAASWKNEKGRIHQQLKWMLGDEPPGVPA